MTAETAIPAPRTPAPRRTSLAWTAPRIIAAAVAAVLAVTCGGLLIAKAAVPSVLPDSWTAAEDATDRDRDVTIVARTFVEAFLTYDYQSMDEDVAALKKFATGKFAEDFETFEVEITTLAQTQKAVSTGDVRRVGVGAITDVGATVDVAATKSETYGVARDGGSASEPTKGDYHLYFHITLDRVGERWLVADVTVAKVV